MMTAWKRTSRERPCPVCGKSDWCMLAANNSVVICPRVEEGAVKYLDGSGYLHVLDKSAPIPDRKDEQGADLPEHNMVLSMLSSKMMAACDDGKLDVLAESISIPRFALRALRAGYSASSDAYSFPMFRAGQRLVGIRLRSLGGKKWAIKGSRQGLLMPLEWPNRTGGILLCEGQTDTAAMIGLGFNAVGRPSAMGSHALVEEAVSGKAVCIISDSDSVGLDSSAKLAAHLRKSDAARKVGILVPPAKDAREWVRIGATRADVKEMVARAMKCDGPYDCR